MQQDTHDDKMWMWGIAGLFVLIVGGMLFFSVRHQPASYRHALEAHIDILFDMVGDERIVDSLNRANNENAHLTPARIAALDTEWQQGIDRAGIIHTIENDVATDALMSFQRRHPQFVEIFITDVKGLNVAQTNRTSDYYQADEAWWIAAYRDGSGHSFIGDIEYDDSARQWVVPLSIPVYSERGSVIGVVKALIDSNRVRSIQ